MNISKLARVPVLALLITFTSACATVPVGLPSNVPLPGDITVTPPSSDVPAEYAAFSGKWVGVWDRVQDHVLVVETITGTEAKVVYAVGLAPWTPTPRYSRMTGKLEGKVLKVVFGTTGRTATYRQVREGVLDATFEGPGVFSTAQMFKLKG